MDAVHMKVPMSTPASISPPARSTYRHGDLRRALLEAGVDLARAGGPEAVVLREATRRAGVVPNAAYRHFASRQDLLQAVRAAALSHAAMAMEAELATLRTDQSPLDHARAGVRAVGTGYLRFALAETGLFRTAFAAPVTIGNAPDEAKGSGSGMNPFELLSAALDRLVDAGALPPERRPGAEFLAWSAVHGMALLIIEGPLRGLEADQAYALGQRLLDMVERGL
jgi:AcrR family transcriptional regulator